VKLVREITAFIVAVTFSQFAMMPLPAFTNEESLTELKFAEWAKHARAAESGACRIFGRFLSPDSGSQRYEPETGVTVPLMLVPLLRTRLVPRDSRTAPPYWYRPMPESVAALFAMLMTAVPPVSTPARKP